jgi:ribosomal protein S18 acetylase RimI-like enzyme
MIRLGTLDDFAVIEAFDPFEGDRRIALSQGHCLVVVVAGVVVGYCEFSPAGFIGRAFVHYLAIHPAHRRQGLALELLRAVETHIGAGRLFISTQDDNHAMLSLLPSNGWTAAGCVQGVNRGGEAECFFYRDLGE